MAPPVPGCGQTRPGCHALHSSALLTLIQMLTLVLTLATVPVSPRQPHAIPSARAKRETVPAVAVAVDSLYNTVGMKEMRVCE